MMDVAADRQLLCSVLTSKTFCGVLAVELTYTMKKGEAVEGKETWS